MRQRGIGLTRIDDTKTTAGRRIVPLPSFAVTVLNNRRKRPYVGQQQVIFASSSGTLRDPENGADHLGHAKVSMTQDRYMSRGRVHSQVADLLDRTVTDINDE